MGLFTSKSASSTEVNNVTTNNLTDARIGVADNGTFVGDGGSIVSSVSTETVTGSYNTTTNNVQVVDPAALTALSVSIDGSLDAITGMTSGLIDGVADGQAFQLDLTKEVNAAAKELFDSASGFASDALAQAEASMNAALSSSQAATGRALDFGMDALTANQAVLGDALDFARVTQSELADVFDTFGDRLANENDDNRAYSSSLVGSVLQQARTSDERNIQEFLTAAKWIVGFVVVAFVAPKVFGK